MTKADLLCRKWCPQASNDQISNHVFSISAREWRFWFFRLYKKHVMSFISWALKSKLYLKGFVSYVTVVSTFSGSTFSEIQTKSSKFNIFCSKRVLLTKVSMPRAYKTFFSSKKYFSWFFFKFFAIFSNFGRFSPKLSYIKVFLGIYGYLA